MFINYIFFLLLNVVTLNPAKPVKGPIKLSASFGELRPSHFHAGIDIKTNMKIGRPLYAISQGYISRIKVSPYGYGKAVYITSEQDSIIAVYAHLSKFTPKIDRYIKKLQYKNKSFAIDKSFSKNKFPIKRKQLIGYSGNSGGSMGPHLHFEVRDLNNIALNPLKLNYQITDRIAPMLNKFYVYSHEREDSYKPNFVETYKVYKTKPYKQHIYNCRRPIYAFGKTSFGLKGYDKFNGSNNKCGIETIEIFVDSVKIYHYKIDEINFFTSKHINAHIDYHLYKQTGEKIHTTYLMPNNQLTCYDRNYNGVFYFEHGKTYSFELVAKDYNGNVSTFKTTIIGSKNYVTNRSYNHAEGSYVQCKEENIFELANLKISLPEKSLFDNDYIALNEIFPPDSIYLASFKFGTKDIPLVKSAKIEISNIYNLKEPEKYCISTLYNDKIGSGLNTIYKNGKFVAYTRNFGSFALVKDTIPPTVKPTFSRKRTKRIAAISFIINDNISGVASYNGYIDGKWVLFEHGGSNRKITHVFDSAVMKFKRWHNLKLSVIDKKGNEKIYKLKFYK